MIFQKICGVDLGTDTIKIRDKSGKHFLYDKNIIALRDGTQVIGVGEAAYAMYEKTPQNVKVVWPMINGVIANATEMELVLYHILKRFHGFGGGSSIYIAVPSDITQVERRAFFHVMSSKINAGKVHLVDKGIADCVGAGLPVLSARGHMIVNIGADTTEIAVISAGKVILSQTVKVGGRKLDEDIMTMVRRKFNLSIGRKTAESLKNNLAFMINGPKLEQKVFGIHTLSGLPKSDLIPSLAVSVSIIDTIDYIVENIKAVYNRIPPQLLKDVTQEGMYLTGGVSMILNLPEYIRREIGIPLHHVQDPANSTVRGLVEILNSHDLKQSAYSLQDLAEMR